MSDTPRAPEPATPPGPTPPPGPAPPPDRVKPAAVAAGVASLALVGGIVAVNLTSGSGGDGDHGAAAAGDLPGPASPTPASSGGAGSSSAAPSSSAASSNSAPSSTGEASASSASSTPGSSSPAPSALAGSWTGTIDGGGDPVGTRITLDGEASALTGQLLFADPDSNDWVPAGTVTAALSGNSLRVQSDTQAVLDLTVDGDALSGTGTLTSTDNPFPVTVTLQRG